MLPRLNLHAVRQTKSLKSQFYIHFIQQITDRAVFCNFLSASHRKEPNHTQPPPARLRLHSIIIFLIYLLFKNFFFWKNAAPQRAES